MLDGPRHRQGASGIRSLSERRLQPAEDGFPAGEPWYALIGERQQVLGLMRAIVCQLAFSHGPDHVQMVVVSSDLEEWDWVKWLPHFGDSATSRRGG